MKRPTDEDILDKIQEIATELANTEARIDELIYENKPDTFEFSVLCKEHTRLGGEILALRWVLGFIDDKNL